jgi:hypothetical protein
LRGRESTHESANDNRERVKGRPTDETAKRTTCGRSLVSRIRSFYFGLGLASVRGARAPAKKERMWELVNKNRSSFRRSRRYVTPTAPTCQWHLLAKVRGLPGAKQRYPCETTAGVTSVRGRGAHGTVREQRLGSQVSRRSARSRLAPVLPGRRPTTPPVNNAVLAICVVR